MHHLVSGINFLTHCVTSPISSSLIAGHRSAMSPEEVPLNQFLVFMASGGATLWQSSANALPVCCHALPVALPVF